jgi:hypothetical protein
MRPTRESRLNMPPRKNGFTRQEMGIAEHGRRQPWLGRGIPTEVEMVRAEFTARLTALAARMSRIEVRLDAVEGRKDESSRNAATGVTLVTPDRNSVTPGSVTSDDAVTPARNANAERQRRYRARKRQTAARL